MIKTKPLPLAIKQITWGAAFCLALPSASANPNGGQVTAGSAQIEQNGANTAINQSSQSAIINWQDFSIDANESVNFYQPSSSAVTLNRVVGDKASLINGALNANGQVFIVNGNGIVFGKNAKVDVGGLIASTFDISDENFMQGNYQFDIPGKLNAGIVNQGEISIADTGVAAFVAPQVVNQGVIAAKFGRIALSATDHGFVLDFYGDQLIRFVITPAMSEQLGLSEIHVNQQGTIDAQGGTVLLSAQTAQQVLSDILTVGGAVRADSVSEHNGTIVLSGSGGAVNVQQNAIVSASAGEISMSGDAVYADGELSTASQSTNGGTISVDAGWLSVGGRINADGQQGGDIQLNAKNMSNAGAITAQGLQGDGGQVSTNVAETLVETNHASVNVSGTANGGSIKVEAGEQVTTSASYQANGESGNGGNIDISASVVKSLSGQFIATGGQQGGQVRLGGEFQGGKQLTDDELTNAQTTVVSAGSLIDVTGAESGGTAIVWSDQQTQFHGSVRGEGAFAEISSAGTLGYNGDVQIGSGELLLDPKNIVIVDGSEPTTLALILGYNYDVNEAVDGSDNYGSGVAIDGTHLAVGASGDDGSGNGDNNTGAVYLYTFDDTDLSNPTLSAVVGSGYTGGENVNLSLDDNDLFGSSVALDGTHLAVGATGDDGSSNLVAEAGAAYLFSFTGDFTSITHEATVGSSYSSGKDFNLTYLLTGDQMGGSVALDSGHLAIGAVGDDGHGSTLEPDRGNVYLLTYTGDFTFNAAHVILGSYSAGIIGNGTYVDAGLENNDYFGSGVALDGNLLAVGAEGDDGSGNGVSEAGAVYLYSFTGNFVGLTQQAVVGADYAGGNNVDNTVLGGSDAFGASVALDGTNFVVGATGDDGFGDPGTTNNAGAVHQYSFTGNFTSITDEGVIGSGYTGGSNIDLALDAGDEFGASASLDGSHLAVGAPIDDGFGNSGTVNESGAVYVFDANRVDHNFAWGFADQSGATSVIDVANLTALLDAGTAVTLQASNDITVETDITANNAGGDGGNLTMQAGRTVEVQADITTDNGDLTIVANETAVSGVVDGDRDAGAADITFTTGSSVNAGTGAVRLTLADGAGNTNNTAGAISLDAVTAGSLTIDNANSGSSVADNAALTIAGATDINATGANVVLDFASNDFDSDDSGDAITVDGATVHIVDTDAVNVGTSNTTTMLVEAGGNITLSGTVSATGDLGDGNNTSVVLASGANFIEGGAGDINPGAGRFLVYSANPSSNTFVDLSANPWYNTTYNSGNPTDVSGTGDRFVYTQSATLTVTADDQSRDYGDANPVFTQTVTGYVNGENSGILSGSAGNGSSAATSTTNVGGIVITASAGTLATDYNYNISTSNGVLTIDPRPITISADDRTKTYGQSLVLGGTDFSITSGTMANLETIGSVTLTSTGGLASNANAGAGTYANNITPSAATGGTFSDSNYAISYASGDLTVNQAPLTITAFDDSKSYDGIAYVGGNNVSYTGFVAGDDQSDLGGALAYSGDSQGATDVGSYTITPGGLISGNYAITFQSGTLLISAAGLTITATDQNKTYGDNHDLGSTAFTTVGLGFGDSIDSVTLDSATGVDANTGALVGTYVNDIEISGATGAAFDPANYTITYVDGDLTVNPAPLTVTAVDDAKTYDGLAYAGGNGVTYSGFVNSEDSSVVGGTLGYGGASQGATNAGGYAITPSGLTASNYNIIYADGTLTINPAPLSITAFDDSKTYDGLAYAGGNGVTYSGFVNGETSADLAGTLGYGGDAQSALNAGAYTITPQGLTSGNYAITFVDGALTVAQAPLTITAANDSKTYDGVAYSGGNGANYTGFVGGDTAADLGGTLAFSGDSQSAVDAGSYTITPSGQTSINYAISFADGTLVINAASLTITANDQSKTYGDNLALGTSEFTATGLVGTDTVGSVTLTSTSGNDASSGPVGNYIGDIVASGVSGGTINPSNYSVSYVNGNLQVNPAALTVTADNQSKNYGDALNLGTTAFTSTGLVNGETIGGVTLTSNTGVDANTTSVVGTYAGEIIASGANGGTFAPSNYTITYAAADLVVDPRPITVTPALTSKNHGDPDPALSVSVSSGSLANADSLTDVVGTLSREAGETVGAYDVLIGVGTNAANYAITFDTDNNAFLIAIPPDVIVPVEPNDPVTIPEEDDLTVLPPPGDEVDDNEALRPPVILDREDPNEGTVVITVDEDSNVIGAVVLPEGDGEVVVVTESEKPAAKPEPVKVEETTAPPEPVETAKPVEKPKPAKSKPSKKPAPSNVGAELIVESDGTMSLKLSDGRYIRGIYWPGTTFEKVGTKLLAKRNRPNSSMPAGLATAVSVASIRQNLANFKGRFLVLDEASQLMLMSFDGPGTPQLKPGNTLKEMSFNVPTKSGRNIAFTAKLVDNGVVVTPKDQLARWMNQGSDSIMPAIVLMALQEKLDVHMDDIVTVFLVR